MVLLCFGLCVVVLRCVCSLWVVFGCYELLFVVLGCVLSFLVVFLCLTLFFLVLSIVVSSCFRVSRSLHCSVFNLFVVF